jgi:hypothetical protein
MSKPYLKQERHKWGIVLSSPSTKRGSSKWGIAFSSKPQKVIYTTEKKIRKDEAVNPNAFKVKRFWEGAVPD